MHCAHQGQKEAGEIKGEGKRKGEQTEGGPRGATGDFPGCCRSRGTCLRQGQAQRARGGSAAHSAEHVASRSLRRAHTGLHLFCESRQNRNEGAAKGLDDDDDDGRAAGARARAAPSRRVRLPRTRHAQPRLHTRPRCRAPPRLHLFSPFSFSLHPLHDSRVCGRGGRSPALAVAAIS